MDCLSGHIPKRCVPVSPGLNLIQGFSHVDGYFQDAVRLVLEQPVCLFDAAERETVCDERRGVQFSGCYQAQGFRTGGST